MARSLRINYPGAFYHVTCRGNERKPIYRDNRDYQSFLTFLENSLQVYSVLLHAYVLMNNHFHLVVEVPKGNLSEVMRHLNITYTGYFNRRFRRSGHLFQGRFKSILIEADSYLQELSRYVHLNPVRLKKYQNASYKEKLGVLSSFRWSSLGGYLRETSQERFIVYDRVLGYMGGKVKDQRGVYDQFVQDGLRLGVDPPWGKTVGQAILGGEFFIEKFRSKAFLGNTQEQPAIKAINRLQPEQVIRGTARALGLKRSDLLARGGGIERYLLMDCLFRYAGLTQLEIGVLMGGIGYSRVSRARKEFRLGVLKDPEVRKALKRVEEMIESQK